MMAVPWSPMLLEVAHALLSLALAHGNPGLRSGNAQAPGGPRDYAIGGSVRRDDNNQPVSGVRVQLLSSAGNVAHSTILTDASGEFSFGQFSPGTYEILADADGYQPARLSVELSRFGQANLIVHIRPQLSSAGPTGDITTAHQLAIPQKARAAYEKGVAKANSHRDYQGAILEFQRAISSYPDYYEAYAEMGFAYIGLKDPASAEKALQKSIQLSAQKYAPPLILLSMLLNDQNRPQDAAPVARQLITIDPSAWRGPYELSRSLLSQRLLPEAESSAFTARDLKPDAPDVYLLLTEIHRRTQNPSALLQDLDTYLRLAPQGPAAPQMRNLREQLLKFMESQSQPKSPVVP